MRNRSGHRPAAFLLPLCLGLFLIASFVFGPVFAATTDTVSFQSKLVHTDGTNITNNTYNFRFRIYTVSSGGTVQWSEDRSLSVTDGVVSADLGSVTPFGTNLFDNANLYLQVCFDANGTSADSSDANCGAGTHQYEEVFTTRKPITAVPLAFRAKYLTDGAGNAFGPNSFFKQGGNAFGAAAVLGTTDTNELRFYTDNTQKMVLTTDGRLGIGTATPGSVSPPGWGALDSQVAVDKTLTAIVDGANYVGLLNNIVLNPAADTTTAGAVGNQTNITTLTGNTKNIGYVQGQGGYISHQGSGILGYAIAGEFVAELNGIGQIDTAIGLAARADNGTNNTGIQSRINKSTTIDGASILFDGSLSNVGVVTSGTDVSYGSILNVTRTGAVGGSIESYGQFIQLYVDNAGAGTAIATGLSVDIYGAADYNYAALFNGGNVGIGTSSPGQMLTVDGTFGILEGGGSPSFHTIFQGGDQVSDITYTLPINDGDVGDVLSSNGSGVLSWIAASSGTGDITAVGSMLTGDAFSDATADGDWLGLGATAGRIGFTDATVDLVSVLDANVGIGLAGSDWARLYVDSIYTGGTVGLENIGIYNSYSNSNIITTGNDYNAGSYISLSRTGATGGVLYTVGEEIHLYTDNAGSGIHTAVGLNINLDGNADYNYAALFNGGNVGIGTIAPQEAFTLGYGQNMLLEGGSLTTANGGFGSYQNYLYNSEDFTQWSVSSGTLTADTQVAPSKIISADTLLINGTSNVSQVYSPPGSLAAQDFTFSVWLKAPATTDVTLQLQDNESGAPGGNYTKIVSVTDKWQRFFITGSVSTAGAGIGVYINNASGSPITIYSWGGQLEDSTSPGVYVKTFNSTNQQYVRKNGFVANGSSTFVGNAVIIANDSYADLGVEKVTNGTITGSSTGWTLGTGWSYTSNHITHASNDSGTVSQDTGEVGGEMYKVTFDVTSYTSGSITPSIGSILGEAVYDSGTVVQYLYAQNTDDFTLISSNFYGDIDNISIVRILPTEYSLAVADQWGRTGLEIRSDQDSANTLLGRNSGKYNATGSNLTSVGDTALAFNTSGWNNTAIGSNSQFATTSGYRNTSVGVASLYSNTVGQGNTALGTESLYYNTSGYENTASGIYSLYVNTTGYDNVADGAYSLNSNITGYENSASGVFALYYNDYGYENTGSGSYAGYQITTGHGNTFLGYNSGFDILQKYDAANSMALGANTYTTKDNQVILGNTSIVETLLRGNVGIGQLDPHYRLEIAGDLTATSPKTSYFSVDNMSLSSLEGGAYFGGTRLSENQWSLNDFASNWNSFASSLDWQSIAMNSSGQRQTAVVGSGYIWISNDFGINWAQRGTSQDWRDVAMSSDGRIQTAVVGSGMIWISSDYGETWSSVASSLNWSSIAMSSDGKYQTAVVYGGYIWESTDFGATWTQKGASHSWTSVAMSSDGKIQTALDDGALSGGYAWVSTNYGATWTSHGSVGLWSGLAMSSDGKYQTAVYYGDYFYISSDYGTTWIAQGSTHDWTDVAMSADGRIQTATSTTSGHVWSSVNYGVDWAQKGTAGSWSAIAMSSDGKTQAATVYGGYIYESVAGSNTYGNVGIGGDSQNWARLNVRSVYSGGTSAIENYGIFNDYTNNNIVSSGNDINVGQVTAISRTGATGGTIYTAGQEIYLSTDNAGAGTHTAVGLSISLDGNADYNYAALFQGGSVGIGTTNPNNFMLEVAGNIGPNTDNTYDLGSDSLRFKDLYLGGSTLHVGTSTTDEGTISYNTTSNVLGINTDSTTNGDIAFFTDDLYLDKSTGNVGIGMTAPTARLEVAGTAGPVVVSATLIGDPGTSSEFASYNFRAQQVTTPSWTTAKNDSPSTSLTSFAYDPVNGVMYAASYGYDGDIYRCLTSTGCDSNGDWASYTPGSNNSTWALHYNPNSGGELYAADGSNIIKCSISSNCDAPGDWSTIYTQATDSITDIGIDTTNNVLYADTGWSLGILLRCDITATNCDASGDFTNPADPSGGEAGDIYVDTVHGTLYLMMVGGDFYRCATSTGCDVSGDFTYVGSLSAGNNETQQIAQDTTNNILYVPVGDTIWRCDLSTNCDAVGDFTVSIDTNQVSGFSSEALVFDAIHGKMFAGSGGNGYIYECSISSNCDASGDWTISYDSPSTEIVGMGYDPVNGVIYAGEAADAIIYRYDPGAVPSNIDYASIAVKATDTTSSSEDGVMTFKTAVNGALTDTMSITAGNVGVGIAAPGAKFDVEGDNTLTSGILGMFGHTATYTTAQNITGNVGSFVRNSTVNDSTSASVAFDAATTGTADATNTVTWSHTVASQTNRILIVGVATDDQNPVSSVTYNGVALTKIGERYDFEAVTDTDRIVSMWYLVAPATGAHNVVVNTSGTSLIRAGASSYYNVSQAAPIGPWQGSSGTGADPSVTVNSSTGEMVVDIAVWGSSAGTVGGGQTQDWNFGTTIHSASSHKAASAGTTTMNWTSSAASHAQMAVTLKSLKTLGYSGSVVGVSSNCSVTAGLCGDSSSLLSLNQQFTGSVGTVLNVTNAGAGLAASFDNTNVLGNGVAIDIQSADPYQYALKVTSNNGAQKGLIVTGDGNVGINDEHPINVLSVNGSSLFWSSNAPLSNLGYSWAYNLNVQNFSTTTGNSTGLAFTISGDVNNVGAGLIFKRTGAESQGELQFYTKNSTALNASPIQAMVINNTQNVGIGATDKLSRLTVRQGGDLTTITGDDGTNVTTTANASTTITGSANAEFLSSIGIGDRISLSSASGTYATVTAIASNTSLTVSTALGNGTSQTINVKRGAFRVDSNASATQLFINDLGNVGVGTLVPSQKLTVDGTLGILETGSTPTFHTILQGGDQAADITYTLPTASTNGVLTNTAGVLTWAAGGSGVTTVGSMTGSTVFADATANGDWLGLGAAAGRIEFDDQTIDEVNIVSANVGIGNSTPQGKLDILDTSNTLASLVLTNSTATTIGVGIDTLGVVDLQSSSLTTGNFLNIEVNGLTSGRGINVSSTAAGLTSGSLIRATSAATTTSTGNLVDFSFAQTSGTGSVLGLTSTGAQSAGSVLAVVANSATTVTNGLVNIAGNALTTGSALKVTSTGTTTLTGNLVDLSSSLTTGASASVLALTANGLNGTGNALEVNSSSTGAFTNGLIDINTTGNYTSGSVMDIASITTAGNVVNITNTGVQTAGSILSVVGNSATTTTNGLVNIAGNGLTTGSALKVTSTGTTTQTGHLVDLSSSFTTGTASVLAVTANGINGLGDALEVNSSTTGALTDGLVDINGTGNYSSGALLNVDSITTAGNVVNITNTGIQTAGSLLSIVGNSATTTTAGLANISGNALTTGKLLSLNSSSAAFTGTLFDVNLTGTNSANTGTLVKISSAITNTGTPLMVTNLSAGNSFRVNDETGDADTTPFLIDASGNVGIGTATAGQKLTVDGTFGILEGGGTPSFHTIFQGGDQAADLTYTLPVNASNGVLTNTAGVLSWGAAGGVATVGSMSASSVFADATADGDWLGLGAAAGRIAFVDAATDFINFTAANVGIGTVTPGQKLTVDGTFGILEGGGSPSFHTIFQGGDQTADYTYTLPVDDGLTGQLLRTDGAGVLSWQTVVGTGTLTGVGSMTSVAVPFSDATADGDWLGLGASAGRIAFVDATTDYINFTSANVGIGVTAPTAKLYVKGTNSISTSTGSNLITGSDGTFTGSSAGWTTGSGWAYNTNNVVHVATNFPALTTPTTATDTTKVYRIIFYIGYTSGDGLYLSLGGTDSGSYFYSNGVNVAYIRPTSGSGVLAFTPALTGNFVGTIDTVTVTEMTSTTPELALENSDGTSSPVEFRAGGSAKSNVFIGQDVGKFEYSGTYNVYMGYQTGEFSVWGDNNVGFGQSALLNNVGGSANIAIGPFALQSNTTGLVNIALGQNTLHDNTSGARNIALGNTALYKTTSGTDNIGIGESALYYNTTGTSSIALGQSAMQSNIDGHNNMAFGNSALYTNTSGDYNVAIGRDALRGSQTGNENNGIGYQAGYGLTSGSGNIFIGSNAGDNVSSGSNNIVIGYAGNTVSATASNQLNIGNFIYGTGLDGVQDTVSNAMIGLGKRTPIKTLDVVGSVQFVGPGYRVLTGSIDPTASTTVSGSGTLFLSQVNIGDVLTLDGTRVITGSIDPIASTAVTGVGTSFTTALKVGDQITVNSETRTVVSIQNNTSLTVGVAFTDTANDTTIDVISVEQRYVIAVASDTSLTVDRAFLDNSNDTSVMTYQITLDVDATSSFQGGATFYGLGAPSAPSIAPQGTTGAATWSYKITAVNAHDNESMMSAIGTTTSGNATLTAANFNRITWAAVQGASSYNIYRVASATSPTPLGYLGTVDANATLQFDDTGVGASGGFPGTPFDETSNVGIGTTKIPPKDTLTVDGRINQTWHYVFADFFGGRANITANAVLNAGTELGFAIIGTSGCTGSFPSVQNGVFRLTTGATGALGCQINMGTAGLPNVKQYDVSYNPVMEVVLNPGATSNKTELVGFTDATTATAAEPVNGVYFYCSTAGTPSNVWVATTARASAYIRQPTGVSCNSSAYATLRIEVTASSARFFINGVLVATPVSTTATTNMPAAGSTLGPIISTSTTTTAAVTVDVDAIEIWQDDPDMTGVQGLAPDVTPNTPVKNNPKLYTDTTYAKGASAEDIPFGLAVSYGASQEFDDQATNKLVYDITKSKPTDKTVLGIGAGLVDPSNVFDANLNPYAVAVSGPTFAWVEEGAGTNIELGDELSLSANEDGYLSTTGTQKLAHALESVDWSTVTEVTTSGKKKKLVKVYVTEGSLPGTIAASFGTGVGANPWSTVDETTIQTPYKVIASSMLATTGDFNVLKARTLNVNDAFMVDDSGNVTTAGTLFATAISTPTIKGVAGGINIEVLSDESFKVKVGNQTAIEASVKGVKVNNLIVSDKQAGKVTIPAGQTQVTVSTSLVTDASIVVVTPNKAITTAVQTNNGTFVIKISAVQNQDVEIGWYIVNVDGN